MINLEKNNLMKINLINLFGKTFVEIGNESEYNPDIPVIRVRNKYFITIEDFFNEEIFIKSGLYELVERVEYVRNADSTFRITLKRECNSFHIHNILELKSLSPELHTTVGCNIDKEGFLKLYIDLDLCCFVNILN